MAAPNQPWVIVVDDDAAVRVALQHLLIAAGFRVATMPSAATLLEDPRLHLPCCVVLDLQMPGVSGLELQSTLAGTGVEVPIVFLTAHGSVAAGVQAMKRGAVDFLEKPVDPPVLIDAVRRALAHGADRKEQRRRAASISARLETLSAREREVFDRLVAGRTGRQIADELAITERTVKFHREHVMEKMRAGSIAELARMAEQTRP